LRISILLSLSASPGIESIDCPYEKYGATVANNIMINSILIFNWLRVG